jgi:hypothetical protein
VRSLDIRAQRWSRSLIRVTKHRRNVSTGDERWVPDDLLSGDGSRVLCEESPSPMAVSVA